MSKRHELSKKHLIINFLKLPNRKPLWQIFYEIIYLTITYGLLPNHYFGRYLFKKEVSNIKDFLPAKILQKIKPFFNDQLVDEVLENKLYYNLFYSQFSIPLPKILMYNHRNLFVIGSKAYKINTPSEFLEILSELMKANSLDSIFIKCTYWTYGGDSIYKFFAHQLVSEQTKIKALYGELVSSGYLFQETIEQHPTMNALNPSCLNTIRMDTFTDSDGVIEVMSAYLRISVRNSHVDNISSGGCLVKIDLETGRLHADGYLGFRFDVGVPITEHPITKMQFGTFAIPQFDKVKELVLNAASYMPGLRLIGWDIGIGVSGPILIEGNSDYDNTSNDFVSGGFLSNKVFLKAWNEYK